MIIDTAELERRYLLRIAGARDKKVYIGPEEVNLGIISACNLRCRFCVTDHSPENPAHFEKANFMPWEKFLGIIRDCVDLNVDSIQIMGTGEPWMHPSFRDMMRHLEQQPLMVTLFTNATFPLDYCQDVIKGDHVVVNLSATDGQQYRDLQGKELFDHVVANIKRLVFLRDAGKLKSKVHISCLVTAVNTDQKKMRDLASKLGVDSVFFPRMDVHVYNREVALPASPVEDTTSQDWSDSPDVSLMAAKYFKFSSRPDIESAEKRTPPVCLNGWFHTTVSEGNFHVCYKTPQIRFADLDKWSLKQFWLSPDMMEIRLLGKYGYVQKMFKGCQTCPAYDKNIGRALSVSCNTVPQRIKTAVF